MSEGLFVETQRLVTALLQGENVKAREAMKAFPKAVFPDLLHIITAVTMSLDSHREEDFVFHNEISKALMVLTCKHPELGDVWNFAINDDVSIHFDNYKPFITACVSGNLEMVRDFRRFQYDEEDGSKMIPDEIWKQGAELAKKAGENEVSEWIAKYMEFGTDDEEEASDVSSQSDAYDDCRGREDMDCSGGNEDGGVDEEDEEDEDVIYEKNRQRLKELRALARGEQRMNA